MGWFRTWPMAQALVEGIFMFTLIVGGVWFFHEVTGIPMMLVPGSIWAALQALAGGN